LNDLLPEPVEQTVEAHLSTLEVCVSELEAMRPWMTPEISEEDFGKILASLETINSLMARLQAYSFL
jgi:hypothetical protein